MAEYKVICDRYDPLDAPGLNGEEQKQSGQQNVQSVSDICEWDRLNDFITGKRDGNLDTAFESESERGGMDNGKLGVGKAKKISSACKYFIP